MAFDNREIIAEDEEVKKKGLVVPKGSSSLTISTIAFSCTLSHNPSLPIVFDVQEGKEKKKEISRNENIEGVLIYIISMDSNLVIKSLSLIVV